MIQEQHGFSERRACKLVGQPRSTQRRPAPVVAEEEERIRAARCATWPGNVRVLAIAG